MPERKPTRDPKRPRGRPPLPLSERLAKVEVLMAPGLIERIEDEVEIERTRRGRPDLTRSDLVREAMAAWVERWEMRRAANQPCQVCAPHDRGARQPDRASDDSDKISDGRLSNPPVRRLIAAE